MAPFLVSARPLSLLWRGRLRVNSMRNLFSILATQWLTYSLPLSAWNPRILNGNCASICSMTGNRCASEIVCTVATTCHCVTQSTALMW